MTYLSSELDGSDSGENSRCGREEGCGRSHGLSHAQVLPPQVEQVHGGHGVHGRVRLLVLCTQNQLGVSFSLPLCRNKAEHHTRAAVRL